MNKYKNCCANHFGGDHEILWYTVHFSITFILKGQKYLILTTVIDICFQIITYYNFCVVLMHFNPEIDKYDFLCMTKSQKIIIMNIIIWYCKSHGFFIGYFLYVYNGCVLFTTYKYMQVTAMILHMYFNHCLVL